MIKEAVCVCVCVYVRARVCAHANVCVTVQHWQQESENFFSSLIFLSQDMRLITTLTG